MKKAKVILINDEEFVENFTEGELTPIDVVSDLTGLTYEEIRQIGKRTYHSTSPFDKYTPKA